MSTNNQLQSNPHKHPLYRPHMGDMTGWRFLEIGEVATTADEFLLRGGGWCPLMIGGKLEAVDVGNIRRRVPTAEKRFITAVLPATEEHLGYVREHAKTYREGNCIELFDGIKDRVNQALEGEE